METTVDASSGIRAALLGSSLEAVKEVQRQAESCLHGTLELAIAADQRATTMSGITGAGAAALTAAAVAIYDAKSPDMELVVGAAASAGILFFAAMLFAWAARPVDFHIAGYEPNSLANAERDEKWTSIYVAEDLQRRIDANRSGLARAGRLFKEGLALAALALPVGLAIALGLFTSPPW
jgi:hypothetical protein